MMTKAAKKRSAVAKKKTTKKPIKKGLVSKVKRTVKKTVKKLTGTAKKKSR